MKLLNCAVSKLLHKLPAQVVVIICSFIVQFFNFARAQYIESYASIPSRVIFFITVGLLFCCYPCLGHLADVRLNRYRTLRFSLVIMLTGEVILLLFYLVSISITAALNSSHYSKQVITTITFTCMIGLIITVIGVGLFEANAIQFGLDQLLEAPTPKLITFIHWYYWSQNVRQLVGYYVGIGWMAVGNCTVKRIIQHDILEDILIIVLVIIFGCMTTTIGLAIFCASKQHFYIQKAGHNPFKNIYKLLKYSWNHKVPEMRSSFTYCEENIPPRIDLGKHKYGGPFTTEEVEDTKTFLWIIPLLLCLFGYHLAGDGYSAPEQLMRTSCPSLPVMLLIVVNPSHMSALVIVVGIPLYRLVITKLVPRLQYVLMLTKIWIGLYISLLQVTLTIIVVTNHDAKYWQQHHSVAMVSQRNGSFSVLHTCFKIRVGIVSHNSCKTYDDPVDNTYLWFIIPQLLNGLSSLFVSMTVFEFICAQAPRTTQGLLIGLWYATFSIRYLVVGLLDSYITERRSWLIYEGAKGFLILVSLLLFTYVSRNYRYRQRDEIFNVYTIIENTYEKWFDQEEEYMQEKMRFYENFKTYNTV